MMKKQALILTVLLGAVTCFAATAPFNPRADGEGSLGQTNRQWGAVHAVKVSLGGDERTAWPGGLTNVVSDATVDGQGTASSPLSISTQINSISNLFDGLILWYYDSDESAIRPKTALRDVLIDGALKTAELASDDGLSITLSNDIEDDPLVGVVIDIYGFKPKNQFVPSDSAMAPVDVGTAINRFGTGYFDALDIDGNVSADNLYTKTETDAAIAEATNALPAAGCTTLTTPEITGATTAYFYIASTNYTLSVSATAPRYHYSIEIMGTNAATMGTGLDLRGTWTPTGTNIVVFKPSTGTVYRVYGRGL